MRIDHINGNRPVIQASLKTTDLKYSSFNRMLTQEASLRTTDMSPPDVRPESSHTGMLQQHSPENLVKIGTITSKNPTVSDLLIRNPAFKKDCWNIIYAKQNQGKEYTRIQAGTDIYYDSHTKALLWGDMLGESAQASTIASASAENGQLNAKTSALNAGPEKPAVHPVSDPGPNSESLNERLVNAIEPMIGKPYSDMNCYELVVNGLSKLGVRYFGRDGLGRQLMNIAADKGLPMNAYLNGEGLTRFSGADTYSKTFMKVDHPAAQSRQVIREITPFLEKGSILSFSMESRGHTGIVSSKNGSWTYINSGVIDHPVEGGKTSKGVGEELLNKEIEHWFHLAARHHESLIITLGKFNQDKLASYEAGGEPTVS